MIVLTGWMTIAGAQDTGIEPPPTSPAQGDTTDAMQNPPLGVVPQPTPESPGLVTGITLGELYTDNLRLAGPGQNKQSSWITEVQPFVKAATGGPRFSGTVDYSITGYLYTGGAHTHQVAQDLKAKGVLTVVPDHLFVAGDATYGRAVINNAMPSGAGTFFLDHNRANVAMASLSPYWIQQFGNVATATVRYTHG
ncbi:MAG TPA: TIGR03016 family PEP-CTERM system-associated outer membrane protein, partial [Rhodanobacteraceae bacterium]|nr:TIGR03016 family PEP-CTERM system-associated outer membrane protein [Rhodanobacteraceae bacterium]